ncbi:MAG: tetratricopeptide repeat protein [Planctomycetota bacterium]|nr:tetratricopeptide repeat protein [Planctomycetota bacterium]
MRYVPDFIEKRYRARDLRGELRAAALFVDISGFTPLMETAFSLGERGAEFMSRNLRRVFDPCINAVLARGGIVTGFAGDGFTAVFPDDDDGSRAISAAAGIVRAFDEIGRQDTPDGTFDFKARCGIAAGTIEWEIAIDPFGRCGYYFLGEPIATACRLVGSAAAGEIRLAESIPAGARGLLVAGTEDRIEQSRDFGPPNNPETLDAFIQDEILNLGKEPEIKPVVSVFIQIDAAAAGADARVPAMQGTESATARGEDIGRILSLARELAAQRGGTFNKLDFGDKGMTILCFFGAPRAIENPARAALDFVEQMRSRLPGETPAHPRLKAGLDSGLAYSGATGGEFRNEWTCIGDCVNTSARLMSAADWGEALVSERVHDSARKFFDFRELGCRPLKGKSKPEKVFGFERSIPRAGALVYEGPMIGRREELRRLRGLLRPAEEGRFAGLVYIYGEPGMGKTRLVQELRKDLERATRPWHWLHLPCLERDSGLGPLTRGLEHFFAVSALTPEEEKRRKVESRVEELARNPAVPEETRRELTRAVSFLGSLVNCHWPDGSPAPFSLYGQVDDPKLRHENQLYAAKELVRALAHESPLVLEVEDSHWLEPSTAEWVKIMTRNVRSVPFVVVLTSRFGEDGSRPRVDAEMDARVDEIILTGFDQSQARTIFLEKARGYANPAPELLDFLMERTGGNPFFLEQMSLHLATGWRGTPLLVESRGETRLIGEMGRLPATLEDLLLARFDRLEANLREGLKYAATLGVRFLRTVLERVLGRSREYEGEPGDVVPGAEQERLIVAEKSPQAVQPERGARGVEADRAAAGIRLALPESAEDAYLFRHVLMQKAIYHLPPPSVRAHLHRLAAEVIEELFPGRKEFCRELADHFGKGECLDKEIDYLEKAAAHAAEDYKNREAIELYSRLVDRCRALPGSELRLVRALYDRARVCDFIGMWAEGVRDTEEGLSIAGRSAEAAGGGGQARSARELVVGGQVALAFIYRRHGRMGDAERIAGSAERLAEQIGFLKGRAAAMGITGILRRLRGDYVGAMEYHRRNLELADSIGDESEIASALLNMGIVCRLQGDYARAMEYYERTLRLCEKRGDKAGKARVLGNIGNVYANQGDHQRAMQCYRADLAIAEELGNKSGQASAVGNIGLAYRHQGDSQRAMECLRKNLQLTEELGDKAGMARAIGNMGLVYWDMGDYVHAMDCYRKELRLAEEMGDKAGKARTVGNMGSVYALQGDTARALEHYEEHLRLSTELGDRAGIARAIGNIGGVHQSRGDYGRSLELSRKALTIFRELGKKGDEARVLVEIGFACARTGDYARALADAESGLRLLEELQGRSEMAQAYAVLAEAHAGLGEKEKAGVELKKARSLAEEFKQTNILREIERIGEALSARCGGVNT